MWGATAISHLTTGLAWESKIGRTRILTAGTCHAHLPPAFAAVVSITRLDTDPESVHQPFGL